MSTATAVPYVRARLSLMMFLQFLLWGSWYVPIGSYMNSTLDYSGAEIGWIIATLSIGAILSPMFVGYVADRLFATERVLAALHVVGGLCLLGASQVERFPWLFVLLLFNALAFMPTVALCNSISFRNIDDPDRFSRIAVWGTIGWILSGWIVDGLLGGAARPYFFMLAGGTSLVMAVYCLTLPHTPPKPAGTERADVLGLGALRLLRDRSILTFVACILLISISLSFYFVWSHAFLTETERSWPTALLTLGQISEILVMLVMPWFIAEFGLKRVLVIGMSAWALRYLLFATNSTSLVVLGLLLHGFAYCFVFVASFIYVNRKAPPALSASAQSLVALVIWGIGMLIGSKLGGLVGDVYPQPKVAATRQVFQPNERTVQRIAELPAWPAVTPLPDAERKTAQLTGSEGETAQQQPMLVDVGPKLLITGPVTVLGQLPKEQLVMETRDRKGNLLETLSYPSAELISHYANADANNDHVLTHEEWQEYRTHKWSWIWFWPALLAAVVAITFGYGGRDVAAEEPAGGPETPSGTRLPTDAPASAAAPPETTAPPPPEATGAVEPTSAPPAGAPPAEPPLAPTTDTAIVQPPTPQSTDGITVEPDDRPPA